MEQPCEVENARLRCDRHKVRIENDRATAERIATAFLEAYYGGDVKKRGLMGLGPAGAVVEIASGPVVATPSARPVSDGRRLIPVARRVLTETRDRILPSVYRVRHRGKA